MKQARHKKSIRWELEQLAQKKESTTRPKTKPVNKQPKKNHASVLNWKDVVLFSLVMIFTTFYNVNVHAGTCVKPQTSSQANTRNDTHNDTLAQNSLQSAAINFDDISSGMMMEFNNATGGQKSRCQSHETKYQRSIP